jgi:hypothetical protein
VLRPYQSVHETAQPERAHAEESAACQAADEGMADVKGRTEQPAEVRDVDPAERNLNAAAADRVEPAGQAREDGERPDHEGAEIEA